MQANVQSIASPSSHTRDFHQYFISVTIDLNMLCKERKLFFYSRNDIHEQTAQPGLIHPWRLLMVSFSESCAVRNMNFCGTSIDSLKIVYSITCWLSLFSKKKFFAIFSSIFLLKSATVFYLQTMNLSYERTLWGLWVSFKVWFA